MAEGKEGPIVGQVGHEAEPAFWDQCTTLAAKAAYPSFFCSGSWLRAVAAHLEPAADLRVLTIHNRDELVGALPLVERKNRLGGVNLEFLGQDKFPDPLGLLCSPDNRGMCVRAVQDHLSSEQGWDQFALRWILAEEARIWQPDTGVISRAPYLEMEGDFDSYLGTFSRKKRQTVRAKVRRFEKLGGRFRMADSLDQKRAMLENLFHLHELRTRQKKMTSTFLNQGNLAFHRQLVEEAPEAVLGELQLDGTGIAVMYGFEFQRRFFYYQIAHDPVHFRKSPGLVLMFRMLEHYFSRGFGEFNFLQGEEDYKFLWTSTSRELFGLDLYSGSLRSRVISGISSAKNILKDHMRSCRCGH
jgi:CelD/BcsL family acetyltransferase involved in cellulose biosynthesis